MEYVKRAVYGETHELSHMMHNTVHGAVDYKTLCGKDLGPMWFIVGDDSRHKKEITCRECKAKITKNKKKI